MGGSLSIELLGFHQSVLHLGDTGLIKGVDLLVNIHQDRCTDKLFQQRPYNVSLHRPSL